MICLLCKIMEAVLNKHVVSWFGSVTQILWRGGGARFHPSIIFPQAVRNYLKPMGCLLMNLFSAILLPAYKNIRCMI